MAELVVERVLLGVAIWEAFRGAYVSALVLGGLVLLWLALRERARLAVAYPQEDLDANPALKKVVGRYRLLMDGGLGLGATFLIAAGLTTGWPGKLGSLAKFLPDLVGAVFITLGLVIFAFVSPTGSGHPRRPLRTGALIIRISAALLIIGGGLLVATSLWR